MRPRGFRLTRHRVRPQYQRTALVFSVQSAVVEKEASDSLGLATDEATVIQANVTASDAVAIGIIEATTTQVRATGSDALTLATTEGAPTILVTASASDTAALGTVDASAVTAIFGVGDTVSLGVTEGAAAVAVTVAGVDALGLVTTEGVTTTLATLSGTETLALAITEQNTLLVALSGSDAVALAATESVAIEARLSGSDAVTLAVTESVGVAAILTASDAVTLALTDESTAPVIEAILGERDLPDILDDIRDCLLNATGIRDVDSFWPTNLGALPRVVLRYLDSSWGLQLQRTEIKHEIEAEIVIAPESDHIRAQRLAASLVNNVKAQLLPDVCVGFTVVSVGSEGMRRVSYHGRRYWAAIVRIRAVETAGATV